jgi:hypothetical protein
MLSQNSVVKIGVKSGHNGVTARTADTATT